MKSVRSNARKIQKKKAKGGLSKVRVHKTILANLLNDPAQSEGEEEEEGIDREA